MKLKFLAFVSILLLIFSCKNQHTTEQNEQPAEQEQTTATVKHELKLPKAFYKHLSGTYFNMPADMDITVIDTMAYITLTYLPSYNSITAVVNTFKHGKFDYNLLQNLKTRDTVETWHGKFTSDSSLILNVVIPVRDTNYTFTENYATSAKALVYVFDTTIYYKNTDQELFIVQTNSLKVNSIQFDFLNDEKQLRQQFFKVYNDIKEYFSSYNPNSKNYFFPFYYNRIMAVEYNLNNLLVISDNTYTYLGGAHGLNQITYYNIDLTTGKLLKLSDIFSDTSQLPKMIYAQVSKGHTLFVDQNSIYIPKNFYLRGSKITFVYGIYEIAPYSEGELEATFSFKDVKNYLNPQFLRKFYPGIKL